MKMETNVAIFGAVAIAVTFLVPVSSASAQNIVVRASGPSAAKFRVGSSVKDGSRLLAGDTITILDRKGTRVILGPTIFQQRQIGPAPNSVLTSLAQARRPTRVLGATRRGPALSKRARTKIAPSLWSVDIARDTVVCLPPDTEPVLWRERDATATRVKLVQGEFSADVSWPARADTIPWPVKIKIVFNREYSFDDGGITHTVLFRRLPSLGDTIDDLAQQFEDRECSDQLEFLLIP
jgi:hypothetical protein